MARARRATEFQVTVGNNIGAGAKLFGKIKEANVDVIAHTGYQIGNDAHFSLVVEQTERAEQVLREIKLEPVAHDVLLVEMDNQTGAFAKVLEEIAGLGIQVRSAYATATGGGRALAVLKTDDDDKVVEELNLAAQSSE
jgi:hypothetical protein